MSFISIVKEEELIVHLELELRLMDQEIVTYVMTNSGVILRLNPLKVNTIRSFQIRFKVTKQINDNGFFQNIEMKD